MGETIVYSMVVWYKIWYIGVYMDMVIPPYIGYMVNGPWQGFDGFGVMWKR